MIKFLHKNNDKTECDNRHGISLVAHVGKVPLKIFATRLSAYCEAKKLLPEEQCGFLAVRRQQDLGRKAHVPLFLCFIDL